MFGDMGEAEHIFCAGARLVYFLFVWKLEYIIAVICCATGVLGSTTTVCILIAAVLTKSSRVGSRAQIPC